MGRELHGCNGGAIGATNDVGGSRAVSRRSNDFLYSKYELQVLGLNPVAYLSLDEASGTTANDKTGNNNDGEYKGSPSLGQPALISTGTSVGFDGIDDFVLMSDAPFDFGNTSFSIAAWINLDTIGSFHTIAHHRQLSGDVTGYLMGVRYDGTVELYINDGNKNAVSSYTTTVLSSGVVYFIVGVVDRSTNTSYVYVDAVQEANADISTVGNISCTDSLRVGYSTSYTTAWDFLAGRIDEFSIHDKALSSAEVSDLYTAGQ